jgi:hypothetical protein
LAQKLTMRTVAASHDTVTTPLGLMDVPRTLALWTSVYQAPEQLVREGKWVDQSSVNLPYHYVLVGYYLANAVAQRGDRATAEQIMHTVQLMARAAGLEKKPGS